MMYSGANIKEDASMKRGFFLRATLGYFYMTKGIDPTSVVSRIETLVIALLSLMVLANV